MSKILKKIKKLLNQERGEREIGNIKTAENYAAKIAELLARHKVELSDVERTKEEDTNPVGYIIIKPGQWGAQVKPSRDEPTEHIASIIATAYFCRMLCYLDTNELILVGREQDTRIAESIFCNIMRVGMIACEIKLNETIQRMQESGSINLWNLTGGNEEFRFSFYSGLASRLQDRFNEINIKIRDEGGNSQGLVLAKKAVDDFIEQEIKPEDLGAEARRLAYMQAAYELGAKTGDKVSLTPHILN